MDHGEMDLVRMDNLCLWLDNNLYHGQYKDLDLLPRDIGHGLCLVHGPDHGLCMDHDCCMDPSEMVDKGHDLQEGKDLYLLVDKVVDQMDKGQQQEGMALFLHIHGLLQLLDQRFLLGHILSPSKLHQVELGMHLDQH